MTNEQYKFIDFWGSKAVERYRNGYTILPSLVIAQAILESGWGTTDISQRLNNYHGIKWYDDAVCRPYTPVDCRTWEEYTPGTITHITCAFCKFDTIDNELDCYYSWLNRDNPYYKQLWTCKDGLTAIELIDKSPYATDTKYGDNLRRIYGQYNLKHYDDMVICDTFYYRVQTGAFYNPTNAVLMAKTINVLLNEYYGTIDDRYCIIKRYGNMYHCQVGAYVRKSNADIRARLLNELGFDTFITTETGEDYPY